MPSWSFSEVELSNLEEGDLIEFVRGKNTYSHWAVYIGNGQVIHLSMDSFDSTEILNKADIKGITSVQIEDIRTVAGNSKTYRNNEFDIELKPLSKKEIVKRAKEKLGKHNYNLATYNCEHFATECRYGQARSKQVENASQKVYQGLIPAFLRGRQGSGGILGFLPALVTDAIDTKFYSKRTLVTL